MALTDWPVRGKASASMRSKSKAENAEKIALQVRPGVQPARLPPSAPPALPRPPVLVFGPCPLIKNCVTSPNFVYYFISKSWTFNN